jgi:hypothetical protein
MRALKTTVYLDEADYRRIKAIASQQGRTPASLVREAVSEFARRHGPRRRAKSVGIGHSGIPDLAERADEMLAGFGRS